VKNVDLQFTFDKYLDYPKEEAFAIYGDEKNLKSLKIFLPLLAFFSGVAFLVHLFGDNKTVVGLILTGLLFAVLILLRVFYNKLFNLKNIRRFVFVFLISLLFTVMIIDILGDIYGETKPANEKQKTELTKKDKDDKSVSVSVSTKNETSYTAWIFFFCILVMVLRFSRTEIIQLLVMGFGMPLLVNLVFFQKFTVTQDLPNLMISGIFVVLAFTTESKRRKNFFVRYDAYYRRNYESARMKKELNYAREIQLSMLPATEALIADVEISAASVPAYEVGGDYFDYFKISESKLGIFICDVSGHGVASALMLSGLRSCMHLILEDTADPKEVFVKLNRMIRKTQSKKMFVTAIFAVLDLENNTCSLFNAGHLPPYKISGDSFELFKIKRHGITLGAIDGYEINEKESQVTLDFGKNDKLVFYTDGVTEAMDANRNEFGADKLESFLYANASKSSSELKDNLVKEINLFTGDTPQKDDMTILTIGRI